MKYILLAILLIVGGLFYLKSNTPQKQHICKLENKNIITIGDSLANGFGVNENDSFAVKIPLILNKTPIKIGINGETTNGLMARIDNELKSYNDNIAAVVISIGGNDFLRKYETSIIERNLDVIIKKTKKYTNCIVLLGVPSGVLGGIAGGVSSMYKDIANKYNIILEDKAMPKILKNIDLKVDQIHPNSNGHEIIANNIVALIKQNM